MDYINDFLFYKLQKTEKPIYIYGMGNGSEKLKMLLDKYSIPLSGVFASDEYVRGHSFLGFLVKKYSEIPEDAIILLAFGAFTDDLFERFDMMKEKHEFYAPDMPLFGDEYFEPSQLHERSEEIRSAYELLCDDLSRKVFENTVKFKVTGDIEYLKEIATDREEIFQNLIHLGSDESFLDLGAYDGDTVREFQTRTNHTYKDIVALEPDRKNYKKLVKKTEDALLLNKGSYSFEGSLSFSTEGSRNSSFMKDGKNTIEVTTIDIIAKNHKPTFIKMDVEGSEEETLKGALKTLREDKPKLIMSAYHKNSDYFELINLLHSINPEYRIYLRHAPYIPNWETNIIAL